MVVLNMVREDPPLGLMLDDPAPLLRPRLSVLLDADGSADRGDPILSLAFDVRRTATKDDIGPSDVTLLVSTHDRFNRTVREIRAQHATPLVVIIRDGEPCDSVQALEAGADDVICPPYEPVELLARLRAVLRRSNGGIGGTLRAGDVELDVQRHEVRRGSTIVALSPTEFAVLACLARRPGRLVSVGEIAMEIWGEVTQRTARLVHSYVKYVRNKLDADAKRPLIRTRRGRGYELSP